MTTTTIAPATTRPLLRPDAATAGRRAAEILDRVEAHPLFPRWRASTLAYPECWATFTGYPIIARWSLDDDGPRLFVEAMRVMAAKASVYELTGDEHAAELETSAPVDEMVHTITAQLTVLFQIQIDTGITFVHMTDLERFTYDTDGYTDTVYEAAGWGIPDRRYWIGQAETRRRLADLYGRYESIGIDGGGRSHDITFG